jgi:phage baseplate assembly protein gpV
MMRELVELASRVAELERRFSGIMRHGKVEEVNTKEAWVRLDFGQGTQGKFLSPKIPYAQIAGDLKLHNPPYKGQQMTMLSPSGDWQQAVAVPMTWSKQNEAPSDKGDEHVLTFGDWRITLKDTTLTLENGDVTFKFSGDGYEQTGGHMTHDGKGIDAHHVHTMVMPGAALSGPPDSH